MSPKSLLLAAAAALAVHAAPALAAEHDHAAMHPKAESAATKAGIAEGTVKNGVRTVEMLVTEDGYVPSKIKAQKGEKLRLVITRKTDRTCAKEIVIKDHGIDTKLPLDKAVTVELTPKASGELRYACGMDMISGIIFVP
jgi:plastocyanin domain-containing protein